MATLINRIQRAFLGGAGEEEIRALLIELEIPFSGSGDNALKEARRGLLHPISGETLLRDAFGKLGLTGGGSVERPLPKFRAAILRNLLDSETTLRDALNTMLDVGDLAGGGEGAVAVSAAAAGISTASAVANLAPTNISLSASTVAEDAALGYVIGALFATDPDDDAIVFSLTDDASGKFGISGSNLIVTGVLDYETATSHNITVRATDEASNTYDDVFAITVTDVDETPPEDPPPDGDPEDDGTFVWTPTVTEVDGGIKISGKKAPSAGKFIYDLGPATAGTTYTMEYDPDFSLMTNQGKNTAVGFVWKDGNDFHFVGNQGDGSAGLDAKQVSGADKWNSGTGWTEDNAGAVTNGTQAGPNFIRLVISEDGLTYTYQTSADLDGPWTDEYTDEVPAPHDDATSPPQFGIGVIFRATDTGSFSVKVTRWRIETGAAEWVTWDPTTVTDVALSGSDLVATNTGTVSANQGAHVSALSGKTTGKYYFETTLTLKNAGGNCGVGIGTVWSTYTNIGGTSSTGSMIYFNSGNIWTNSGNSGVSLAGRSTSEVIGVAVDLDNRKIWFRVAPSGNWNNSGSANPATNTLGVSIPANGTMVPFNVFGGSFGVAGSIHTTNFGALAFSGAVPSGFTAGWPAWTEPEVEAADGWTLVDSWTHSGNVAQVDFTGLAGYTEVRVVLDGVSTSVTGVRLLRVSVDNGSTFVSTGYIQVDSSGVEGSRTAIEFTSVLGAGAKSGEITISGWNLTAIKTAETRNRTDFHCFMIPTASALNALRITNDSGNLTGGSIYVYAR